MARQAKRKRRQFGTAKPITKHGHPYLEYSYPTPIEAHDKWPDLPDRCYKIVPPEDEMLGEAWLDAARIAIKTGTWTPPQLEKVRKKQESITFREFATEWVEHRKKADGSDLRETAKQDYRESLNLYLLPYFGDMSLSSITPKNVQAWFDAFTVARVGADRDSRRAHVYAHLKAIMRTAATEPIDNEGNTLILSSPCRIKVSKPAAKHKPVRPTREQLDALLAALPDNVRMVAAVCDSAGLREGEALGLCRKHIDAERLVIHVRQQVQRVPNPKTGKRETVITPPKTSSSIDDVAMTPALADMLTAWMNEHGVTDPDAPLFVSRRTGTWISPQTYRDAFAKARKKVPGLETMRPHDLRKDCLSRMMESGATTSEVMRQGRHTTMAVASKYQVTGDGHLSEVMARMNAYETGAPSEDGADAAVQREDAGDGVAALAGVVAGLAAAARCALLRSLPAERRTLVLEALPEAVKVETLTELLKEGAA